MLLIDASTSLLQIGQTFNGDSSKRVGKRPFSMRIAHCPVKNLTID